MRAAVWHSPLRSLQTQGNPTRELWHSQASGDLARQRHSPFCMRISPGGILGLEAPAAVTSLAFSSLRLNSLIMSTWRGTCPQGWHASERERVSYAASGERCGLGRAG